MLDFGVAGDLQRTPKEIVDDLELQSRSPESRWATKPFIATTTLFERLDKAVREVRVMVIHMQIKYACLRITLDCDQMLNIDILR